ncbi:hypothetical protein FBQ87_04665, partial [Sphingobacteriales bacterium CHB3]|nr:hypothetical protein [Sphingobacteriales bacterium CHB3]
MLCLNEPTHFRRNGCLYVCPSLFTVFLPMVTHPYGMSVKGTKHTLNWTHDQYLCECFDECKRHNMLTNQGKTAHNVQKPHDENNTNMRTELEFALELAECATREILPRFHNCTVNYKSDGTEVTDADRAAESTMRNVIAQRFSDDDVLGEEWGRSGKGRSSRMWILDP